MPQAHRLILSASLSPEALALARKAFDETWELIAGNYQEGDVAETARMRLATIILGLVSEDSRDVEWIRQTALQLMSRAMTEVHAR